MDRVHDFEFIFSVSNPIEGRFLQLVASTRNKESNVVLIAPSLDTPNLVDARARLRLVGFWPCVEYLCERYPEPTLLPADCVLRGAMRSLTHELLTLGEPLGTFARMRPRGQFIVGARTPSLLDLAYLAVTDADNPSWCDLHAAFARYRSDIRRMEQDDGFKYCA